MALDAKWIDFTAVDDAGRTVRCHRLIHMLEERRLDGVDKLMASIIGSIDARIVEGNQIEYACNAIGAPEPVLFYSPREAFDWVFFHARRGVELLAAA